MNTSLTIAYCAGILDADGCITLVTSHKNHANGVGFSLRVSVNQTAPEALRVVSETLGGTVRTNRNPNVASKRTGRPRYEWQLCAQKAEVAIRQLLPYLRIKRQQADLALQFQEMLHNRKRWTQVLVAVTPRGRKPYHCRRYRLSDSAKHETLKLVYQLRSLNDSRATHQRALPMICDLTKGPIAEINRAPSAAIINADFHAAPTSADG